MSLRNAAVFVLIAVEDRPPSMAVPRNRTVLEKCTHLYDDTQETIKQKRFRQRAFVRCKKIENKEEGSNNNNQERSKEEDRQEVDVNLLLFVMNGYTDLK